MQTEERKLAEAAARLTVQDFTYLKEHGMIPSPGQGATEPDANSHVTVSRHERAAQETVTRKKKRERRSWKRTWPEIGTVLQADYHDEHYEVEVIPASRYKSGRALKILTGPAAGKTCHSFSGAMLKATATQRREQGLGRKGMANGWGFWRPGRKETGA